MRLKYEIYANGTKTRDTKYLTGNKATTKYLELVKSKALEEFRQYCAENIQVKETYPNKKDLRRLEISFTNYNGVRIRHIYSLVD